MKPTAADKEIQSKLAEMQADGVVLEACVVCADSYGVTDQLRELGIEVKPMGKPLTDTIKDASIHLVTFCSPAFLVGEVCVPVRRFARATVFELPT